MALYGGATHGEHQAVADCVGDAREDEHQHAQDAARALRRHAQEGAGAGQHSRVAGFWILAEDLKKKKTKKGNFADQQRCGEGAPKKTNEKGLPSVLLLSLVCVCARVCPSFGERVIGREGGRKGARKGGKKGGRKGAREGRSDPSMERPGGWDDGVLS